jgi:hypothetical protein
MSSSSTEVLPWPELKTCGRQSPQVLTRPQVNQLAWQVAAALVLVSQWLAVLLVELISLGQKLLGVRLLSMRFSDRNSGPADTVCCTSLTNGPVCSCRGMSNDLDVRDPECQVDSGILV